MRGLGRWVGVVLLGALWMGHGAAVRAQTAVTPVQVIGAVPTLNGNNALTGANSFGPGCFTYNGAVCDASFNNASVNVGDVVANGIGTTAAVCHGGANNGLLCLLAADCPSGTCSVTGFRVQADRPVSNSGTPVPPAAVGRQILSDWSFDPANRSVVVEFVGDGISNSKQYIFVNGHLGAGSSFGTPVLTSTNTQPFGLEGVDGSMSVVTAPTGANQTILRALTFSPTGIGQAAGLKHQRVTTGSIGATTDTGVAVTWTTAFADANYTVTCTVQDATAANASLKVVHLDTVTAATATVRVRNDSAGALTGTLHCVAMHD